MSLWRLPLRSLFDQLASRLLLAAFLVFASYNPTGRCFARWAWREDVALAWRIAAGGVLAVALAVALRMAARALGLIGALFCTVVASSAAWVLQEAGWLSLSDARAQAWFLLSLGAFVLGVGLCWVRLSGGLDGQLRTIDLTS